MTAGNFEVEFQAAIEEVREKIPPQCGEVTAIPGGVLYRGHHWDLPTMARYLALTDLPFKVRQPPELQVALVELAGKIARLAGIS